MSEKTEHDAVVVDVITSIEQRDGVTYVHHKKVHFPPGTRVEDTGRSVKFPCPVEVVDD